MPRRIDRLDRMIERAHSRRHPKPIRSLERHRGIVNYRPRLQPRVGYAGLHQRRLVRHAPCVRVLARRQRRRNRNVNDLSLAEKRMARHLARIDRASAAEAHQAIGIQPLDQRLQFVHAATRHVLSRAFEHPHATRPRRAHHLVEQLRCAECLPGHYDRAVQPTPLEFPAKFGNLAGP